VRSTPASLPIARPQCQIAQAIDAAECLPTLPSALLSCLPPAPFTLLELQTLIASLSFDLNVLLSLSPPSPPPSPASLSQSLSPYPILPEAKWLQRVTIMISYGICNLTMATMDKLPLKDMPVSYFVSLSWADMWHSVALVSIG